MDISIVIPNYNGEQLLKKNLPNVIEAANFYGEKTNSKTEIIVVDDASADDSIEEIKNQTIVLSSKRRISKIKNKNQELKTIKNERNVGFSSTVNRGVKESKGQIVVLLNTDVSPEKDFLISLIDHFKNDKVFAVGCMDRSIEGAKIVLRGRGLGSWKRGFLIHKRGKVDRLNTLWINGGSGAFRKSIWEKLGGFNTIYNPFYWEDIDLSYRALKSGYQIIFDPKSIITHEHESGAIKNKYSSAWIKRIAYRNQFVFVWVNATDLVIFISHIFWLPYHILGAIKRFDISFFLGFFDALILLPKVIKSRINVKKSFIKTDKEVILSVA